MIDWIGWLATAVFAASYLSRRAETLRLVQAGAALLWIVYGVLIHAVPVVVANLVVAIMAVWTVFSARKVASIRSTES